LIIIIFQHLKRVSENGLIAYIGLCSGLQERVNVKDFGQYLLWALDGDDEDCARVACGIISDIASALQDKVETYLTSFVPSLLNVLNNPSRSRTSKLHALQSIGDLAIYAPIKFCEYYLVQTLQILKQAGSISLKSAEVNDQELHEYLMELKTNVLNCYSTVASGAKEAKMEAALLEAAPELFQFLQANLNNVSQGVVST
jgi:hypothetical protein